MAYLGVGLVSLIVSLAATPALLMLGNRMGLVCYPGERRVHDKAIPCVGGVGFYVSMLAAFSFLLLYHPDLWSEKFWGLIYGSTIIILLGVYDDIHGASAWSKLIVQTAVALFMYYCGYSFGKISNPFGGIIDLGWLSLIFTIVWFVGIMNAINLVDGLDGLAAGIVCIAAASLFLVALSNNSVHMCLLAAVLMGCTLGFLPFNFHPARIFMGDTGAMFLGLVIAAISVLEDLKGTASIALLAPIVALGMPILDTFLAVMRRTRNWRHPFRGDMEHLHHRLLILGLSQRQVVLFIYGVCLYLGITAFVLSIILPQYTFLVLLILGMGAVLSMRALRFFEGRQPPGIEEEGEGSG